MAPVDSIASLLVLATYLKVASPAISMNPQSLDRLVSQEAGDVARVARRVEDLVSRSDGAGSALLETLLGEHDIEASSLLAPETFPTGAWDDLAAIEQLTRTGAVTMTEGSGAKGRVDKQQLAAALDRLLAAAIAPVEVFSGWVDEWIHGPAVARYPGLLAMLGTIISKHIDRIDRERLGLQRSVKHSTSLPIRGWINESHARLDALRARLDAITTRIEGFTSEHVLADRELAIQVVLLAGPVLGEELANVHLPALGIPARERGLDVMAGKSLGDVLEALRATGSPDGAGLEELLAYLVETRRLPVDIPSLPAKEKKASRQAATTVVKEAFLAFVKKTWDPARSPDIDAIDPAGKFSVFLPRIVKATLDAAERDIMTGAAKEGIDAGQARVMDVVDRCKGYLDTIGMWIADVQPLLLGDLATLVHAVQESLPHQHAELDRFSSKMGFYFTETRSQEEKVKIRDEIQVILEEIDDIVNRFEQDAGVVLNGAHVDTGAVNELLSGFAARYKAILARLETTMNRYDAFKLMGFVEDIRQFVEKRGEKITFISNMIAVDLGSSVKRVAALMAEIAGLARASKILSIEQGAIGGDEVTGHVAEASRVLEESTSSDGDLDEVETRKALSLIEDRLAQIDVVKKILLEKKDKLLFLLLKDTDKATFLEERRVGECIICYAPVTTLDEEVIVCPHCGRVGHYLCLAFWLEKYSMCPVCHGKLVKPDEFLHDEG